MAEHPTIPIRPLDVPALSVTNPAPAPAPDMPGSVFGLNPNILAPGDELDVQNPPPVPPAPENRPRGFFESIGDFFCGIFTGIKNIFGSMYSGIKNFFGGLSKPPQGAPLSPHEQKIQQYKQLQKSVIDIDKQLRALRKQPGANPAQIQALQAQRHQALEAYKTFKAQMS